MTRQRKHDLFVTFHYYAGERRRNKRRNKRRYTNIFANFLNLVHNAIK